VKAIVGLFFLFNLGCSTAMSPPNAAPTIDPKYTCKGLFYHYGVSMKYNSDLFLILNSKYHDDYKVVYPESACVLSTQ
jgi:hypothetical protein